MYDGGEGGQGTAYICTYYMDGPLRKLLFPDYFQGNGSIFIAGRGCWPTFISSPDVEGCLFHIICVPIPEGGTVTAHAQSLVVFFQNKTHSNRDHRHIMVARVAAFSEHQLCQF